jgi:hypothetical protein
VAIAISTVPNPMRGLGVVRFWLPRNEAVTLDVVDARGRRVARLADGESHAAGLNEIPYDPRALGNGLYFLRLRTTSAEGRSKIAIVR